MFRATQNAAMKYRTINLDKLAEAAGQGFSNTVASAGKSIEERGIREQHP